MGAVRVPRDEGAFELRPDDKDNMAAWSSGVEDSWQLKKHVQRPQGRNELGMFRKARVAKTDWVRRRTRG